MRGYDFLTVFLNFLTINEYYNKNKKIEPTCRHNCRRLFGVGCYVFTIFRTTKDADFERLLADTTRRNLYRSERESMV